MSELLFTYRGKELVKPLSALLLMHEQDIAAVDLEIAQQARADIEAAKKPPLLTAKETPGTLTVRRLLAKRADLEKKLDTARRFLFEAKRAPRAEWRLDMDDHQLLYPRGV
jgi:hypothetical protein